MKRIAEDRRAWLEWHAKAQGERSLGERRRRRERRISELTGSASKRASAQTFHGKRVQQHLVAPKDLSLSRNYDQVMELIEGIRSHALKRKGAVYVDMNEIEYISPAATLLLVAELDRWQRSRKIKLRPRDVATMHDQVLFSLAEMGFFNILGVANLPPLSTPPDATRPIRFCSGNQSDLEAASKLSARLIEVAGGSLGAEELLLNDAIAEAMTNSVQHAYPAGSANDLPVLPGEWWVTGTYDPKRRLLTVLIYDQGVGIPVTLPHSQLWQRMLHKIPKLKELLPDDAGLIEAAVAEGRTSTGASGRGLGLAEMAGLVYSRPGGHLRILSGRGEIRMAPGEEPIRKNHGRSLGGTLVEIALTLS